MNNMEPKDPHDLRKSDIEDAAIDGEQVPRISAELYLCPACGKPLVQSFPRNGNPKTRFVYCGSDSCQSEIATTGVSGRTFDEAAQRLREKVGEK